MDPIKRFYVFLESGAFFQAIFYFLLNLEKMPPKAIASKLDDFLSVRASAMFQVYLLLPEILNRDLISLPKTAAAFKLLKIPKEATFIEKIFFKLSKHSKYFAAHPRLMTWTFTKLFFTDNNPVRFSRLGEYLQCNGKDMFILFLQNLKKEGLDLSIHFSDLYTWTHLTVNSIEKFTDEKFSFNLLCYLAAGCNLAGFGGLLELHSSYSIEKIQLARVLYNTPFAIQTKALYPVSSYRYKKGSDGSLALKWGNRLNTSPGTLAISKTHFIFTLGPKVYTNWKGRYFFTKVVKTDKYLLITTYRYFSKLAIKFTFGENTVIKYKDFINVYGYNN